LTDTSRRGSLSVLQSLTENTGVTDLSTFVSLTAAAATHDSYKNVVVATLNDHVVRLSAMTRSYGWHYHPNSDEVFIGFEGVVVIEFEHSVVQLGPGEVFTVAKGVVHRTRPLHDKSVNLTIELAALETTWIDA
jgi:mannose-6-phosphate isomerase-like protein (cupin superfamily)